MMDQRKTNREKIRARDVGPLHWPSSSGSLWILSLRDQFLDAACALNPEMDIELRELLWLRTSGAPVDAKAENFARRYNLIADEWWRVWLREVRPIPCRDNPGVSIIPLPLGGKSPFVEIPPSPDLTYNPTRMSREVIEGRVRQFLDEVDDAHRQQGYVPITEHRSREHFYWLAGYQCLGWSKRAISDAMGADRAAILRAIRDLAEEIYLPLRLATANNPEWTAERIVTALKAQGFGVRA